MAHSVGRLASLDAFTAINSALQVDLLGQVNTIGYGSKVVGGVAGILDFATAGSLAGKSIIALESRRGDDRPAIVARAWPVSLPAALVTHVVTEYGVAAIQGKSPAERSEAMIAIAHPGDRDALQRASLGS